MLIRIGKGLLFLGICVIIGFTLAALVINVPLVMLGVFVISLAYLIGGM